MSLQTARRTAVDMENTGVIHRSVKCNPYLVRTKIRQGEIVQGHYVYHFTRRCQINAVVGEIYQRILSIRPNNLELHRNYFVWMAAK